jgi:CDGSH-type Zn-finger protein
METMDQDVVIKVRDNGPYKVTGPVTVVDAEGNRFDLPEGPVALCRCGQSQTKPSATPRIAPRASTRASARPRSLSRP